MLLLGTNLPVRHTETGKQNRSQCAERGAMPVSQLRWGEGAAMQKTSAQVVGMYCHLSGLNSAVTIDRTNDFENMLPNATSN